MRAARLARFYGGVDVRTLGRFEQYLWELAADRLWAEEVLRDRGGSLDAEQLYHLTYLATGDKLRAQKARARRVLDLSRR